MTTTSFLEALQWRYATKKFDPAKKVSDADLQELLEAARLAPSSFGLQPWAFVVVTDASLRKKLREHAWNQPQVEEASHLIVLCARTDVNAAFVTRYVQSIAKTRGVPEAALETYKQMMIDFAKGETPEGLVAWASKQVYLALGILLEAAALKRIDACPMEGFDAKKFDETLDLAQHNLTAAVLCTIGHRAADDKAAQQAKVRFPLADVVLEK